MENMRKDSQEMTTTKDIVSEVNGDFGRWQLRTILLIFLCKIPTAWFTTCVVYTAPTPERGEYYCKPNLNISNLSIQDVTKITKLEETQSNSNLIRIQDPDKEGAQITDRQFRFAMCNIYEEEIESQFSSLDYPQQAMSKEDHLATVKVVNVMPCKEFEFNSEYQSLIMEFDLVCSRQALVTLTQSFHGLGALCGGLFAVKMLKYVSPRHLMLCGMVFQIICGILTGIVTKLPLHIFFRCLTSICCALMYTSGQTILTDITSGKAKTITMTLFELFWSIGLILLPGISIFFNTWSHLYVAISAPVIILVILHRWIADSPRWLLRHSKIDDALQTLLESAAFNNRDIPLNLESELEIYAKRLQNTQQPNYWSIWNGETKRYYLYSVHVAWAGATVIFNVMILMIRSMGIERIHINTVCLGLAEMLGIFVGLYFILFTRRCWLCTGYVLLFAGLFTYFIWLVPETIQENRRSALEFIFWICLKFAISVSLAVLTTCTSELVTAEKRPILMLSVVTFSRCFLLIGPFSSLLATFHKHIPITFFASLASINGVLMCLINRKFWNFEHPRTQKVLTPKTYRRRLSSIPDLCERSECKDFQCYHNRRRVSITDIWEMESEVTTTNVEEDRNTLSTNLSCDRISSVGTSCI